MSDLTCHLHYCAKPCPTCAGHAAVRQLFPPEPNYRAQTPHGPAVITFKEQVFANMFSPWEKPFPISDPGQLRRECEKRGVFSHALRESLIWRD